MKLVKRITLGLSVLAMVLSATGCGSDVVTTKKEEKVKLKYIMAGPGAQQDSEKVWKAFNKKLQEKLPNVEVQFEIISGSEYKQKFMLMQASKEKIDIANTYTLNFADEVRAGSFLQIDGLLDEYGADLKKALPEWLWGYGTVQGGIYAVPSYQMMAVQYGFRTQKELADKYLDVEKLKNALYSSSILTEEFYDIIEEYLAKLKENNELHLGFTHGFVWKGYEHVFSDYIIRQDDEECKVVYRYQMPEAKQHYARNADWYKKGYIRQDSLSANDHNNQIGKKNGYTVWSDQTNPWIEEIDKEKYGIDILNIDLSETYYIPSTNAAGGTAIMEDSESPESAMQVLNLIQTDKELYNLLVYGIEGDHFQKTGEDKIQTEYVGQGTINDRYGLYKWIIGNTSIAYDTQTDREGYKDWVFNTVNKSEYRSKLIGFVPDTSKIASKVTQTKTVKGEYHNALLSGALPNWESMYAEWMDKLEKAGNQEIIDELQRQVDEFLAQSK